MRTRKQADPSHEARGRVGNILPLLLPPLFLCFLSFSDPRSSFPPARGRAVSTFGKRYLREVELIAEVTVRQVYHLGMGVDVVKVRPDRVILDLCPKGKRPAEPLVLAHRDEYLAGAGFLLLLRRYHGGERWCVLHGISRRERNYAEKVRLVETYVRIESLRDPKRRIEAMVKAVLGNLKDESTWVRSNSLLQLEGLVKDRTWPFTTGDVAFLRILAEKEKKPDLKKRFQAVVKAVAARAKEGPCSIPPAPEKKDGKKKKAENDGGKPQQNRKKNLPEGGPEQSASDEKAGTAEGSSRR